MTLFFLFVNQFFKLRIAGNCVNTVVNLVKNGNENGLCNIRLNHIGSILTRLTRHAIQ